MTDQKNYLQYVNFPLVPEYLLESHNDILNKQSKVGSIVNENYQYFQTKPVNNDLLIWTKNTLGNSAWPQYQIIKKGLPIHKDLTRRAAFNYLINPGGLHVITGFFNDNKQILYYEKIKSKTWHCIKTDVFHGVFGITGVRIAFSVEILNYQWGDDI